MTEGPASSDKTTSSLPRSTSDRTLHPNDFVIRPLEESEDLFGLMEIQYAVWGREEAVTSHQMIAALRNGGIIIGAHLEDQLVGFSYGFPGYKEGRAYLCSHMLAVLPELRNAGLGWHLKLAQREAALQKGYSLITWTYDPLQAPNARLNLGKLRALTRSYVPDYYGKMLDQINQGLASDRFVVEWHLKSQRVVNALSAYSQERAAGAVSPLDKKLVPSKEEKVGSLPLWGQAPKVNEIDLSSGRITSSPPNLVLTAPQVIVTIPGDFQALKQADLKQAKHWREITRQIFLHYFRRGYAAVDFSGDRESGCYLLERKELL